MSKRLLLVEDEVKLRDQLLEILDRHDYEVESCTDGMEGLYL
ncbi:MAG: DNA-binding response OmpR family regulator, partial [Candidatus Azotimanducaceae bacterium]